MLKFKIVLVFLFVGVFIIACAKGKVGRREFVIADSKSYEASLYRQNCAICHGNEANGREIDGKLVPSLRYGEIEKRTEEEIYHQIKEGKLPMPGFKNQLTDVEIRRMTQFIRRSLQGKE